MPRCSRRLQVTYCTLEMRKRRGDFRRWSFETVSVVRRALQFLKMKDKMREGGQASFKIIGFLPLTSNVLSLGSTQRRRRRLCCSSGRMSKLVDLFAVCGRMHCLAMLAACTAAHMSPLPRQPRGLMVFTAATMVLQFLKARAKIEADQAAAVQRRVEAARRERASR